MSTNVITPVRRRMIWLTLANGDFTMDQIRFAGLVGFERRMVSIAEMLNSTKHAKISDWATDINGAIGEYLFACYLGVRWQAQVKRRDDRLKYKQPDVDDFQVRATTWWRNGKLIIRPDDNDGEIFVLVLCDYTSNAAPRFCLAGTYLSTHAKRPEWLHKADNNGGQYWEVPQDVLNDLPDPAV